LFIDPPPLYARAESSNAGVGPPQPMYPDPVSPPMLKQSMPPAMNLGHLQGVPASASCPVCNNTAITNCALRSGSKTQ
jgi:hypothetical protein